MFLAYVKQCLVPTLKRGEIVLMDHLPIHKVAGVAEAYRSSGRDPRTPTYVQPDIPTIAPTQFPQPLHECAEASPPSGIVLADIHQDADSPHPLDRLCTRRQRPCRCRDVSPPL